MQHDMMALELACDSDAMDDVIIYLYKFAHNLCLPVTDWGGSLLMERNRNVHLVKGYFANDWSWNLNKYLYCPQKDDQWIERAYYCLHNNDPDLHHLTIGWPFPMESALEAVVEAIKCNNTVEELVIREGDTDLFPQPGRLSNGPPWWDGKEQVIKEAVISALESNTTIKEI